MRLAIALAVIATFASTARATTIHGSVYDDLNRDRHPTAGEPGVANVVVAFGIDRYAITGATGEFTLDIPDGATGIVWARVPDGFAPGPAFARWTGKRDRIDIALRRTAPHVGPVTFVVASDTHIQTRQEFWTAHDLAAISDDATALDPAPAFFTITGDITQGNSDPEFDLVDWALKNLAVPYVPVAGNHDWYDGGATWFRRYGPDNYSFDVGSVHFVVWNMAMSEDDIRTYLGGELAHIDRSMTVVAMTHAPPSPTVIDTLHELGVRYLITGHTHTNREIDHDGLIELNTEPMIMGGLDLTPAGYRVVTIDGGRMSSYHRVSVDGPIVSIVSPSPRGCIEPGEPIVVSTELDAGDRQVTARVDCTTPIAMSFAGGWAWTAPLPQLAPGAHSIIVDVSARAGGGARTQASFEVCERPAPPPPPRDGDWPQLGGNAAHTGARTRELAPPVVAAWATPIGGHVLQAQPVIAGGRVFVPATDLGDGNTGGVVALELATGAIAWRHPTESQVRGGVAVVGDTVIAARLDGVVLGLDAMTGDETWRYDLGDGVIAEARTIAAAPAADTGDAFVGNQRAFAAISARWGAAQWRVDPVPAGVDSESLASVAIGDGVVVGAFNRALGGIGAWDRITGTLLWRIDDAYGVAVNASPVIADHTVFVSDGSTIVLAADVMTGRLRWHAQLEPEGFEWGHASVGAPAYAKGLLLVPTLYRDLVALDAATGAERWRYRGKPSPIRIAHYRGAAMTGFEAQPLVTGDVVWQAGSDGTLAALALETGEVVWQTQLGTPLLSAPAASGSYLVLAGFDGVVRALVTAPERPALAPPASCDPAPPGGCCDGGGAMPGPALLVIALWWRRRRA